MVTFSSSTSFSSTNSNVGINFKSDKLTPPFKSILRLMFFSLFLLIVGQSSFAKLIEEPKSSQNPHEFDHSLSASSYSLNSGADSQTSTPSLEDSPRTSGNSPAFSSSDFSFTDSSFSNSLEEGDENQHFFKIPNQNQDLDEMKLNSRDENKVVGGNIYSIQIRDENGNGKNGNSKNGHGKDGKDSKVDSVGNGNGNKHSIENHPNSKEDSMVMGLGILNQDRSQVSRSNHFESKPASHRHRKHHHHRPSHLPSPPEEKSKVKLGVDVLDQERNSSVSAVEKRHKHYKGKGTYFKPGTGACGHHNDANDLIVALDQSQYSQARCGKYLNVCHQNKCVRVKIVDECPSCSYGSLDLSPSAFQKLAPKSQGVIGITWSYTS